MGKLIRIITSDGAVLASAVNSTDIVSSIEEVHHSSAVVTAALGRLATGAVLMGSMMKEQGTSVTLRIDGNGPCKTLLAVSDKNGNVKAYVENPVVEIPLNSFGKLDVGSAVGRIGTLSVIKDYGTGEPQTGHSNLVTGEIGDDITAYYGSSEQIPTVCALGVLVNRDLSVKSAGGILIQLLPGADDNTISKLENNIKNMKSVSSMVDSGLSPLEMLGEALKGFSLEVIDEMEASYNCDCSRDRVERALASLGEKEIDEMIKEGKEIEVKCHFCNKDYTFTKENLTFLKNFVKKG